VKRGWSSRSSRSGEKRSLLISSTYYPPQVGGISNMMKAIAHALGDRRVCCLTGVRSGGSLLPSDGRPRVYRRPWAFAKSTPVQAVGWGLAMLEILGRERPRAVQIATVYDGYLGLWLKRRLGLPFLVYAYGNEILDVLRQGDDSRLGCMLREADKVIAISHYTAELTCRAGVSPDRIEIIHPGCDGTKFRPVEPTRETRRRVLGTQERGPVLLSVGNLVARKGHDLVLQSIPRLLDIAPDLVYLVVGAGPERGRLDRLVDSLGVKERVVFAGQVPDDLLPEVYSLADVFVLPSREEPESCDVEGFGLVFLEANACGLPVVAGRSGGIPDAVEAGVTGLLVDPTDEAEIGDAIARLLVEPDHAHRMGRQGRSRVLREFQWPDVGDKIQAVVDDMVAGSIGGRPAA